MSQNGTILVVEDDSQLNELVGAYVQLAGYQYKGAPDGASAVAIATAAPPALVVLDLMLPDIDGFEVCRRLKSAPATTAVPILMLTAMCGPEARQKGLECGAVAFMTKPFDPDGLMAAIRAAVAK